MMGCLRGLTVLVYMRPPAGLQDRFSAEYAIELNALRREKAYIGYIGIEWSSHTPEEAIDIPPPSSGPPLKSSRFGRTLELII
jgi:hypothetical protein